MERMNRLLAFNDQTGLLKAEAGTTLQDVLDVFMPRGWFLPVTPGTKFATLGGCFAADVHGKNHHCDGTFSCHVKEIELVIANGTRRRCSPKQSSDLFWATAGGMGLTGIITELTLQLIPIETAYMVVNSYPARNLSHLLELLEDPSLEDRYSVAWIDCLARGEEFGRGILMNGHHAQKCDLSSSTALHPFQYKPSKPYQIPFHLPNHLLNYWSIKTFNSCYFRTQSRKSSPRLVDCHRYFFPLDAISHWNRIYGRRGFLQYQFVIPACHVKEALPPILEKLAASRLPSFLAVLKRFGAESKGFLSFPKEGITLALDIPLASESVFPLLDALDELLLKCDGRVYLAKDARLKASTFYTMYPRFPQWRKIKHAIDPHDRFSSDLSRRLHLEGILGRTL